MKNDIEIEELIRTSGLFDEAWYRLVYPDAEKAGLSPISHFLKYGAPMGRQPNSTSQWKEYIKNRGWKTDQELAQHVIGFFSSEKKPGLSVIDLSDSLVQTRPHKIPNRSITHHEAIRVIQGEVEVYRNSPNVLVCAHAVSKRIYGGERSFIDMLDGLSSLDINCFVTVPNASNSEYITEIKKRSIKICVHDYNWWHEDQMATKRFEFLIEKYRIDAVHVNTIMLREALLAARSCGVPGVMHVRELIYHDKALSDFIGLPPDQIVDTALDLSDYIAANSEATANCFYDKRKTYTVPNCIPIESFDVDNVIEGKVRIALISSNLPKKGIHDFVDVAAKCEQTAPAAEFLLIGPDNEHILELQARQRRGDVPRNIRFCGYVNSSLEAICQANVILNLSHFQESFGRTVIEAMAARRPVIAYDWGALGELVDHGINGFLAPFGDTNFVAHKIVEFVNDIDLIPKMGAAGRCKAVDGFSKDSYAEHMRSLYQAVLPGHFVKPASDAAIMQARPRERAEAVEGISVIIPNYNYEPFLKERIQSILNQSLVPNEIIFLDDTSSDESLFVALRELRDCGVDYRIASNTRNAGTYRQWHTGIHMARFKHVWIAEADDVAAPDFLKTLWAALQDTSVSLAYCQSEVIDEDGNVMRERNLHHTDALDKERWTADFNNSGIREVVDYLVYRNTIPNVSACLFRRDQLVEAVRDIHKYRFAGDWAMYCKLLLIGRVHFFEEPLNKFRRHSRSVTRTNIRSSDYLEELLLVRKEILQQFPIHQSQLALISKYTDDDYKIEGIEKNSESKTYKKFEKSAAEACSNVRRVVLLTTNNGSFNGGSEMLWIETARLLREQGHDVAIVIKDWSPAPPFIEEFLEKGIAVWFKGGSAQDEIKKIENFRPDLIVVSTGDQDEGTQYFSVFAELNLPYVIINQLTKQVEYWPLRKDKLPAVRDAYRNARCAYFTCWNNHRVMEERLSEDIPNAAIHYNPYHIDRECRLEFPCFSQGPQIAMPAKLLHIHKGQKLIFELLAQPKWRGVPLTINLYGEGPDEQEFRTTVKGLKLKCINFHDRVPDLMEIWKYNHAILMPSFMEGLPIVLVGAMLSARVPILTNVGGHREVVEDNKDGFIASLPTVESLDDALERAIANLNDWEEIGLRARQRILDFLPEDPVEDFVQNLSRHMERSYEESSAG